MRYFTTYQSPIGVISLACEKDALIGLWIEGQKYHGSTNIASVSTERLNLQIFNDVKKWLDSYFDGNKPSIAQLKLQPAGSVFRQSVWDILCQIPYGELITYGAIAKKMATSMNKVKMSSQAVGGAVGHNPISIIIPCHRVVGTNGSLTGYAGGISTKVKLLELEGVDMSKLFVPKKGTAL